MPMGSAYFNRNFNIRSTCSTHNSRAAHLKKVPGEHTNGEHANLLEMGKVGTGGKKEVN